MQSTSGACQAYSLPVGLSIRRFALTALGHDAPGIVQSLGERLSHSLPDGAGLAVNLALHVANDGALALDSPAHALELAGMCIAPGIETQLLALFDKGLRSTPASLAASTSLARAVSSKRLSVG